MLGIIDVGGGNRGAFGAGVLDYCMDHGIMADYCIGVSAGSANCVSYIAGQRGRNYRFYTKYNISDDAISLKNRLTNHALVNLDYIFSTVSNDDGADPLDYTSFAESSQNVSLSQRMQSQANLFISPKKIYTEMITEYWLRPAICLRSTVHMNTIITDILMAVYLIRSLLKKLSGTDVTK